MRGLIIGMIIFAFGIWLAREWWLDTVGGQGGNERNDIHLEFGRKEKNLVLVKCFVGEKK